jgi:RsiW-degrading membrane proteinase PrsW (M82 family)
MRSIPSPLRVFFFIVVPIFAVLFFAADQFSKNLNFSSKIEEFNYYKATKQDKLATEKALSILGDHPSDFEKNSVFLNQYLKLDDKNKGLIRNKFERVFNTSLFQYFKDLSNTENQKSIGFYGLARLSLAKRKFSRKKILAYINNIDEQYSGLNMLLGDYFLSIDSFDKAESYYEKELLKDPESTELKERLARIYFYNKEFDKAFDLIGLDQNINPSLRFYVAKKNGFLSVFQFAYYNDWNQLFKKTALSSLLILFFWIIFISILSTSIRKFFLTALIIAAVIFLLTPVIFIVNYSFNELFDGISNPFLYHFLCVAIPEELLKISAVIFIFYLFKFRNRTLNYLDFIVLGVFSAAAFAFFENNLYFNSYADSTVVFGRFVNASFTHVICTSTLTIGLFYGKFFKDRNYFYRITLILFPFLIHAVYNTCLETIASLAQVVVIVFFILWIFLLNKILKVNNAKILNTDFNIKMSNLILLSLPTIILVQYVLSFDEFGGLIGEKVMYSSIMNFGFTLLIASVAVLKLNDFKFFRSNLFSKDDKSKVSALRLKPFDPVSRNFFKEEMLVEIEQEIKDDKERVWYLTKYQDKNYLLRVKDKYIDLDEYRIKMICLEIDKDLPKQGFTMKDFTYSGVILSSPDYSLKKVDS